MRRGRGGIWGRGMAAFRAAFWNPVCPQLGRSATVDWNQPPDGRFVTRSSPIRTAALGCADLRSRRPLSGRKSSPYDAPLYRGLSSIVTPNCAANLRSPCNTACWFSMLAGDPICSAVYV